MPYPIAEAYLAEANLNRANLKGVKNLERARNLGYALFSKTRVGKPEAEIINRALEGVERLIVE